MTLFNVEAEIVDGARDTGRYLQTLVMARDRLDAAIIGEQTLDKLLPYPKTQWTHAVSIEPVVIPASVAAVAA